MRLLHAQEHKGALKVVKVEHDTNKGLVEKYKVWRRDTAATAAPAPAAAAGAAAT